MWWQLFDLYLPPFHFLQAELVTVVSVVLEELCSGLHTRYSRVRKGMGVTDSNDCWLGSEESLGGLGDLVGREAVQSGGLGRELLAAKDSRGSGLNEGVVVLELGCVGELGLCDGTLELVVLHSGRGALDGRSNTLSNGADVGVGVGLDHDGEERCVGVGGNEGADGGAWDLCCCEGEGGRTGNPLEG